ncbi:MAG: NAD(P)-dependent oxidoreductase [Pseudomonadota bacterium]
MRHFPLFLNVEDAQVLIIGGNEGAAQKFRLLSRSSARIGIMAEALVPELRDAVADGLAHHIPASLNTEALAGTRIVVICTGCAALDASAADLARRAGALVNVVDRPALSDAIMPAIVDRDPVVVAIGTEGTAPVLARQIKTRLEAMLEPSLGRFAAGLGALRPQIAHRITPRDRRAFWEWLVSGPRQRFAGGAEVEALAEIEGALIEGYPRSTTPVSVIPTADADMMTLRAVQRLQSADLILHEPGTSADVLDLARRDAERERIEPTGPARWTIERTARRAMTAQHDRAQTVWLTDRPDAATAALAQLRVDAEAIPVGVAPSAVVARAEDG